MYYLRHLFESSPIFVLLQLALTVWMLVDASRRRVEVYWYWLILALQPFGAWAYFIVYKARDFRGTTGRMAGVFYRPPSLAELRHRAEQTPTVTSRLELAERLVETAAYAEAVPLLEAVLTREPDHGRASFLMAQARRGFGEPAAAVPLLKKIVSRQPGYDGYAAWYLLIDCCREADDAAGAVEQCRGLARSVPRLEHTCLLAEHLVAAGEAVEAKKVVQQALEDYQFAKGHARRRDRRWVGRAKQFLKQIG